MQGSINFDGSLVGNITKGGGGGGGGDTVIINPVVTSGTKIADVTVNGVEKDLYCPTPPTPPEVDITPVVTSGTKIADVTVGGVEKDLYAPNPTQVNVNQVQQSGTKIATIGVNGVNTDIYAPESSGGGIVYSVEPHKVGTWTDGTITKDVWECSFITSQSDQESQHDLSSLNIDRMLLMNGMINLTNNTSYPNPFYLNSSNYAGFRWIKPYLVTLICGDYWNKVISIEYTIRYTTT